MTYFYMSYGIPYEIPILVRFLHFIVIQVYWYDTNKRHNIFPSQNVADINILVSFSTVFIIDLYLCLGQGSVTS